MANSEIERKFLIREGCLERIKEEAVESYRITQGYICPGSGRTVRVRRRDDKAFLTIKTGALPGHFARFEWEKEISLEDAEALFSICPTGYIDKCRHIIPCTDGKHKWEVDEFFADNEGLVVAEIELEAEDEAFEKPDWLGEEVTGIARYYNSALLANPYKDW